MHKDLIHARPLLIPCANLCVMGPHGLGFVMYLVQVQVLAFPTASAFRVGRSNRTCFVRAAPASSREPRSLSQMTLLETPPPIDRVCINTGEVEHSLHKFNSTCATTPSKVTTLSTKLHVDLTGGDPADRTSVICNNPKQQPMVLRINRFAPGIHPPLLYCPSIRQLALISMRSGTSAQANMLVIKATLPWFVASAYT
jgi:hypothetical protein